MRNKLKKIKEIIENGEIERVGIKLGEGDNAVVYKIFDDFNVKIFKKFNSIGRVTKKNDFAVLEDLAGTYMFPEVYIHKEGEYIIKEHIEGNTIINIFETFFKDKDLYFIEEFIDDFTNDLIDIYDYCIYNGYIPYDINHSNIIVRNDCSLCVIDVGNFKKFSNIKGEEGYITDEEGEEIDELMRKNIDEVVGFLRSRFLKLCELNDLSIEEII